jgi:Uma2 family endonuclease
MATVTKTDLMTAEEFMAADLGDGTFELVRGEVVEMPLPTPEHGRVCGNAYFVLESYGRQSGLGYALANCLVDRRDTVTACLNRAF